MTSIDIEFQIEYQHLRVGDMLPVVQQLMQDELNLLTCDMNPAFFERMKLKLSALAAVRDQLTNLIHKLTREFDASIEDMKELELYLIELLPFKIALGAAMSRRAVLQQSLLSSSREQVMHLLFVKYIQNKLLLFFSNACHGVMQLQLLYLSFLRIWLWVHWILKERPFFRAWQALQAWPPTNCTVLWQGIHTMIWNVSFILYMSDLLSEGKTLWRKPSWCSPALSRST